MSQDTEPDSSRRSFFSALAIAGTSAVAAISAVLAGGFLFPIPKKKPRPQFVCLESDAPQGKPLEIQDPNGRKVLLMRDKSNQLMAIGTVCSHLGCAVYYRPKDDVFECPCHQGFFDAQGNPIAGPPRRPLDRFPVTVFEGKVFVEFA
jgi:cytochrome b6-f complex iron-sulfur subunit